MISLRPLHGMIGKTPWGVRENTEIPKHILDVLDIEALKKAKSIAESPVRKNKEQKKADD